MPRVKNHRRPTVADGLRPVVCVIALLAVANGTRPVAADEPAPTPLHQRIDTLVEAASPGPQAPLASDAEFLRRAYLDLTGTIPDAATARVFLDDADPNKRAALIDRLLASPRFARHMQHTFDVMWTERRRATRLGKGVADAEWEAYLNKSFAENKPLDQLIREVLGADGADPELRAAAKFYLDREGEPNLLARDVGRLFFGRDLQCAQCHDHPLVDDYLQSEYYGLMAFVNRGTMFTDEKDEKKLYFAELADGEVGFKSVFTGNAREQVLPELPQEEPVAEPELSKEEQYVVAPTKDKKVRPVPKYSRRAQLATLATSGTSEAFNRNLANRLWAQMLGRGIVHPLDMQHSDNPPVQSELLTLLADELVKMKYDVKAMLREIALSQAYQRSSVPPDPSQVEINAEQIAATMTAWKSEAESLAAELPKLEEAVSDADTAQSEAYEKQTEATAAHIAAEKSHGEAKKASDELAAALAAAIKEVETKEAALKALVAARKAADDAVAKLPEDKEVAAAAATFKKRSDETDTALAAARGTVKEKTPQVQAASLKLAETDKTLKAANTALTQAKTTYATAEAKMREANWAHRAAKMRHNELTARIADTQLALDYQSLRASATASQAAAQAASDQLAALESQESITVDTIAMARAAANAAREKTAADVAATEKSWNDLVERAEIRFTLAPLKPLTPEQLTWSTMQAIGMVDAQQTAQAAEAKKQAEAAGEMSPEAREKLVAEKLEDLVDNKLKGNIKQFVELFGQQPGQPPSFQATVHQALFLANGGLLAGWINPAGGNLTERLAKIEDPQAVADEMYLSIFTRRAEADEVARVAEYWAAAEADKGAAAREMVWSLLTSNEFRFNH